MTIPKQEDDLNWARKQISQYKEMYPKYEKYAKILQEILSKAAQKIAPLSIVQTRAKSVASFGEKIWRKRNTYPDPINQFTDLCGARVITHTEVEVTAVCDFVKKNFDIDWNASEEDISQRLNPSEFGYRSIHYIVKLKQEGLSAAEDIPPEIFGLKSEIQVRTLLEQAWADFAHDRTYKSSFQIPRKWQRELAVISASLEQADRDFSRIHSGLQEYASNYDAYMSEEEINSEIKKLEIIQEFDPNNIEVAYHIGRLAKALGNWNKVVATLSKFSNSGFEPLLRDLGVALCKGNPPHNDTYKQGQEYLRISTELVPSDADALCSLAGSYKGIDDETAQKLYYQAFELDPTNPYAVGNYLNYEIARTQDLSALRFAHSTIEAAMKKCIEQIEVKMNLPWAYFDIGKFNLLLGNPYESLSAYALPIQCKDTAKWTITTTLEGLIKNLSHTKQKPVGYEWVLRLLLMGQFTKSSTEKEKEEHIKPIKALSTSRMVLSEPVIIFAGGCNGDYEAQVSKYRSIVLQACDGFRGTIISGGTTLGISGFAGEVAEKYSDVRAYGYVPAKLSEGTSIDKRYSKIRRTDGDDFSPLEPLQYWIDIISCGICPSQVRLLGIGGGKIAAAEYQIALALGAHVALIEGSGREAAKILSDPAWRDSEKLVSLPPDKETIRAYLNGGRFNPSKIISCETLESIAEVIHSEYKRDRAKSLAEIDPAMAYWNKLPNDLKESNLEQASKIFEKLSRLNCTVIKVINRPIALMTFTDDEIELMAEMEHGRWTSERLLSGWTLSEKRDVAQKKTPHLGPWADLSDEVKNWDRLTVRKIPELLAKFGLEIRRKEG